MEQPVRVGVVGAGTIAQRLHLPTLGKIDGARVVALAEPNAERARECAGQFDIARTYGDYREMLAGGGLDAVLVITPNALHAPVTLAALEAGCHVLVEKPMAANGDEARRMADAAAARGKVLTINFPRRFAPLYEGARRLVADGELGEVYQATATLVRRAGIPGYGSWFTTAALSGGGALLDIGVHILDIALWILGEPEVVAVSATTSDRLGRAGRGLGQWGVDRGAEGPFDVEDTVLAHLRCADGLAIALDVTWAAYAPNSAGLRLLGTRGGAVVNEGSRQGESSLEVFTDGPEGPLTTRPDLPEQALSAGEAVLRGFLDSVRTGAPPPVPAAAGVRLARLCDAIYASARAGREVRLAAPAGG